MSISSEISRISNNVSDALDAIEDKGVTIPSGANSDDLATLIAQISGGGTAAISVVDTTDTAGGTIRTITALDISDTTCTAADVLNSKYFYTAAGVKTQGTATGGGGGATQHVIHLEFADSTDTDINVYYDDSYIGTIITAYEPTTYSSKTVDEAQLDGVTWYQRQTGTWETIYETNSLNVISDSPYNYIWLSSLADVYPAAGEVWRITIDGDTYICTAIQGASVVFVGNPKYAGGSDDGQSIPMVIYNAGYGALMGDTSISATNHYFKLERQVTS